MKRNKKETRFFSDRTPARSGEAGFLIHHNFLSCTQQKIQLGKVSFILPCQGIAETSAEHENFTQLDDLATHTNCKIVYFIRNILNVNI